MYHFSNNISKADNCIFTTPKTQVMERNYRFKHLVYPDVYIPNRSMALGLSFMNEDSPTKKQLREAVNQYNSYIDKLESIPGFLEFFVENGMCVSKDDIKEKWSKEIAEIVFGKKSYVFSTDISIIDGFLFDKSVNREYEVFISGESIALPIGKRADEYPSQSQGKRLIWNWIDNGHDFCLSLWEILGAPFREVDDNEEDPAENEVTYYSFDAYDQIRGETVEPQLVNIFHLLENEGYISAYTIKPEKKDPLWRWYGKTDNSIDLAFVDLSFLKNKPLADKIFKELWTKTLD